MGEKSGLVALDVDTRHDGDKSLTDMIEEFGDLPETITATTGSGGKHYVFKYTEELCLKNVVGFLFKLTDFELFVNGKKSKSYLPGEWRDYFGTPVEQHEESYKINLADGYITTDKT